MAWLKFNQRINQITPDIKLILHAINTTKKGVTKICICSPDTDAFILSHHRYLEMCKDTVFLTGTGHAFRSNSISTW